MLSERHFKGRGRGVSGKPSLGDSPSHHVRFASKATELLPAVK
jgi:hypothetical protein